MNDKVPFFGGSIPENYDEGLGPHFFIDYAMELSERVAAEDPESVLELAAGTGIVTRQLRNQLPLDCTLIASDLSPLMLGVAAAKFGGDESVSFEEVDAMTLPFDDGSFDVIVCQFGVMFFPDKIESYREALRALKPGGVYHFNVWDSFEGNPFARVIHETVERFFPDDPPQFYKIPFSYPDPEVIEADLREAGFEDISFEAIALQKDIDYPLLMRGLIRGNPLMTELEELGADINEISDAIEEALKEEFGDPGKMPLRAIFVRAG
ncbi:MAG: class I SAM-dependent methyltransferase [Alphaproteobacteria bacterium]